MFPGRLVSVVLTVGFALTGCAKKQAPVARMSDQLQSVEVTRLSRQDLEETVSLVGSVAANEAATIRPETTGLVREIHFEEGQRVNKGDLLVKIDDAELKAQFAQSDARYQLAEQNLQRAELLGASQSNSLAEVDRARSEFAAAKSERELIRVRLDRSEVRAPFDGVLGARTLSPGDYVNPQSVITTIDDLSRLKIEFQVPERFAAKVRPGTKFALRSSALPTDAALSGEVYFVSAVVDRETRSSAVKGYVVAADSGLKPGMFTNVDLVLDVRRGVLTVPEGAILTTTAGTQIVTVNESTTPPTAAFVPVRTGLRAKGVVEVEALQGQLSDATQVVASGVGALILYPGTKLELKPQVKELRTASLP